MKPNYQLKRARELHGWSQARVASEIGTDAPSISRWERGCAIPSPYFREKLCLLFQKDAEVLGLLPEERAKRQLQTVQRDSNEEIPDKAPTISHAQKSISDSAIPSFPNYLELIGRNTLFQSIIQKVFTARYVALWGLPGVGKTALAAALARSSTLQERFPDGVLWASLDSTSAFNTIFHRWATLLGIPQTQFDRSKSNEDWMAILQEAIGDRQFAIIIDDVWSTDSASALSVGGHRCTHIITTRAPWIAHSFATNASFLIDELSEQDSLTLLTRIVPWLVQWHVHEAQNIVQMVGGLPLALSLIGKHLHLQEVTGQPRRVQDALKKISDSRQRLHLHDSHNYIRHPGTLRGVASSLASRIANSERLLHDNARQALYALSIFPAKPKSFAEEAALAICQVSADVLDTLNDIGLLETSEAGRYTLHQTIADYASMHLDSMREIKERMVHYMVEFAERHTKDYGAIEQDYHNIRVALDIAFKQDMMEYFVRGVTALLPFFSLGVKETQALTYVQRAYHVAHSLHDYVSLMVIVAHLGQFLKDQNEYTRATLYLQEGLELAQQQSHQTYSVFFVRQLGEIAHKLGDIKRVHMYLQEGKIITQHLRSSHYLYYPYVTLWSNTSGNMHTYFTEIPFMIHHGYIADIHQLFQEWRYADSISPVLLQLMTGTNGHIYGLPSDCYTLGLAYNRRLFAEAGLDPDRPPTTWEEFRTFARQVTSPAKGIYGFAEPTIHKQGGWHYVNWLYTAGVQPEQRLDNKWIATFNAPRSVQLAELLKEMRFTDGSIFKKPLLANEHIQAQFAQGNVAMIVASPYVITHIHKYYKVNLDDFGLAPMPQNGGNACLVGGNAYVFDAEVPGEMLQNTFHTVTHQHFDFDRYEEKLQHATATKQLIGVPDGFLVTGTLQQKLADLTKQYANVPLKNYRFYTESTLTPIFEPPVEAQKCYALLDTIMHTVLTDPRACPQQLLDAATQHFQQAVLDPLA